MKSKRKPGQGRGNRAGNSPQMVAARLKAERAVLLRARGHSYEEIAAELKLGGKANAYHVVERYWSQHPSEEVEQLRKQEQQRLDIALNGIWDRVVLGEDAAIDRFIKISKRRSELTGMDAPVKTETFSYDMTQMTEEQLERVANGEHPVAVMANAGASHSRTETPPER
jgi:hypothetical protein